MVKKKVHKIVLDTNLLVAAYFNPRSASARIIKLCRDSEELEIVYSRSILKEVERILRNIGASKAYREGVSKIFKKGKKVDKVKKHMLIREDYEDNKFLDCAIAEKASYIITNDVHMLKLRSLSRVKILKPTKFLQERRSEEVRKQGVRRRCERDEL